MAQPQSTPAPGGITGEQVRHMARLARLQLTADEVREHTGQLAAILDYMRLLQEVDTTGVEPLAHPLPVMDVLREDTPHTPLPPAAALANAPQQHAGFFKVPAVLTPGSGA